MCLPFWGGSGRAPDKQDGGSDGGEGGSDGGKEGAMEGGREDGEARDTHFEVVVVENQPIRSPGAPAWGTGAILGVLGGLLSKAGARRLGSS